jgi:hypothetical protein
MTLLGAVDNLIHRVESRQHGELPEDSVLDAKTGIQELDELSDDFAELENLDYTLKEGLGGVEGDMKILVDRWKDRMARLSYFQFIISHSLIEGGVGLMDRISINQVYYTSTIQLQNSFNPNPNPNRTPNPKSPPHQRKRKEIVFL